MDAATRIAQFENMVQADPENDMAHFSLGGAYAAAGRHADAARSYQKCFALNPSMSKAYQMAGQALIAAGDETEAKDVLLEGFRVASRNGDFMPRKAMGDLLTKLGVPLPQVAGPTAPAPGAGSMICARTGKPGTRLPRPPFKGPIGEWIAANITQETWQQWIAQGTKVINELRLDLSRDDDADAYDKHMREFLGIDEALYAELTTKR